jgi:hypothetical protein
MHTFYTCITFLIIRKRSGRKKVDVLNKKELIVLATQIIEKAYKKPSQVDLAKRMKKLTLKHINVETVFEEDTIRTRIPDHKHLLKFAILQLRSGFE